MFMRILKKDLQRKKLLNCILLAFVFISALFLASSAINFVRSSDALERFAEMSRTPDYYIGLDFEQLDFEEWVKRNDNITEYEVMHYITQERVTLSDGRHIRTMDVPNLVVPGKKHDLVFDMSGNIVNTVELGKIAISLYLAEKYDLQTGDTLSISLGSLKETLTISHILKDYAYGHVGMGFNRALISHSDFDRYAAESGDDKYTMWSFSVKDLSRFINDKNQQDFLITYELTSDVMRTTYILEQITSATMLIVSAVLIIIAISLLRFTIRFTIEEDFREIGVMKAIGVKETAVRRLYLVKYLAIALVGAALGGISALPFSKLLIVDLGKRIVLIEGNEIYIICAICAACVVGLVMLFCWRTTGRIRKVSAIQAIREGSSGERFKRKGILRLRGGRHGSAPVFMACNDILAGLRNYIIIFLALVAGLQLIILPFNLLTTMTHGSIIKYMALSGGDFYVGDMFIDYAKIGSDFKNDPSFDKLVARAEQMEREYAEKGVDVSVNTGVIFRPQVYVSDPFDQITIIALTQTNGEVVDVNYLTGTPPKLSNEIAMTTVSLGNLDVSLGDSVHMVFGDDDHEYIVTATFESVSEGGAAIILPPGLIPDIRFFTGVSTYQLSFRDRENIPAQIEKIKAIESEWEYNSPDEVMGNYMSDVVNGMEYLIKTLTIIALGIITLVTFLICNTLIARDKGSVALLKSIGFNRHALRVWQTARIIIVSLAAGVAGVGLSYVLNPFVTRGIFGLLGAPNISTQINAVSVLGIYPALFLAITTIVALLVSFSLNRVNMRNVGNLE